MRRSAACLTAGVAALALVPGAGAALRIRQLDTTAYPQIGVTVVASKRARSAPSFAEGGVPVSGLALQNLGDARSIVLAIDRSQSMKGRSFSDALAGARGFIRAEGERDRVSIVAFGSHALTVQPFAQGGGTEGLGSLTVDDQPGTALYDGIVLSAHALGREQLLGRVLIVLTDGTDISSRASLSDAIEAAREAGALVYPIGIASSQFDATPLQSLAAQTGGRYTSATSTGALRSIYRSIAAELGRTWHATYLTSQPPGTTLELETQLVGLGSATASAKLTDDGAASATSASPLIPSFLYGTVGSVLLGLLLTALVAVGLWSARGAREGSWVTARLAPHVGAKTQKRLGTRERLSAAAAIFSATEHAFGHLNLWKGLTRKIERADLPLRTVEFAYVLVGAAVGFGLFMALLGQTPFVILFGMAFGASLPLLVLQAKVKKRLASFETQLPDLLVTMAASLKAGHSFKQGLQAVVDENQQPASDEFRRVLTETSLGRPMDAALREMSDRICSKNFDFVITAVTIQRQVGGSLAELFDMVAETVRQRQQFARKIKALTSMGRASAYVLIGLPFFLAIVITLMNAQYMHPLYATSMGHVLIGMSLVGMVIGSLMLKKIVSFRG